MISKPVHTALKSHYSKTQVDIKGIDTIIQHLLFLSPQGQQNQRRASFPKAKLTPGSVCLSESNIINILWANKNTKALLQFSLHSKLAPLDFKTKQNFQYVHESTAGL
ncbi:hypothetical protein BG015_006267 [Linnemannia schmuckeri]|uniref:Uncharacterized protein n=1 Tax=Linnemannia schmuckeri TaxID=64567 RepID=A0A9P5VBL9_9FUNG|nr:hypothetical protein BG015_006267 [Linnemannia schmuckeri]